MTRFCSNPERVCAGADASSRGWATPADIWLGKEVVPPGGPAGTLRVLSLSASGRQTQHSATSGSQRGAPEGPPPYPASSASRLAADENRAGAAEVQPLRGRRGQVELAARDVGPAV